VFKGLNPWRQTTRCYSPERIEENHDYDNSV